MSSCNLLLNENQENKNQDEFKNNSDLFNEKKENNLLNEINYTKSKNINHCKLINKQYIYCNNYKKSKILNHNFINKNIFSTDIFIQNKIYNLIDNPYQKKLNLINLILQSDLNLDFKNYLDLIKFFNWLYPLTIEYNMASGFWIFKSVKFNNSYKILLQNSISRINLTEDFYFNYINKIKNIISNCKIKYYYFEFKCKRFNKTKDIIWVFDKN